jgi:ABC-type transporter Mla maintaining outer membrane lipid asymmetry ATPase subunit MlaF
MVVVSHHIPSTMRMADHVVLLLPGRALEGRPTALRDGDDAEAAEFLNEDAPPATGRAGETAA